MMIIIIIINNNNQRFSYVVTTCFATLQESKVFANMFCFTLRVDMQKPSRDHPEFFLFFNKSISFLPYGKT